jgi:hypothetical protein
MPNEDDCTVTHLLSEPALGVDWERPEEDEAWQHLQPAPAQECHPEGASHQRIGGAKS